MISIFNIDFLNQPQNYSIFSIYANLTVIFAGQPHQNYN